MLNANKNCNFRYDFSRTDWLFIYAQSEYIWVYDTKLKTQIEIQIRLLKSQNAKWKRKKNNVRKKQTKLCPFVRYWKTMNTFHLVWIAYTLKFLQINSNNLISIDEVCLTMRFPSNPMLRRAFLLSIVDRRCWNFYYVQQPMQPNSTDTVELKIARYHRSLQLHTIKKCKVNENQLVSEKAVCKQKTFHKRLFSL